MPNGEIKSTNNKPHYDSKLPENEADAIRYNFGFERYIAMPETKVTNAQLETLLELLDYYFIDKEMVGIRSNSIELAFVYQGDHKVITLRPSDYLPDDVIKKIKRYYSSGILHESKRRNK